MYEPGGLSGLVPPVTPACVPGCLVRLSHTLGQMSMMADHDE